MDLRITIPPNMRPLITQHNDQLRVQFVPLPPASATSEPGKRTRRMWCSKPEAEVVITTTPEPRPTICHWEFRAISQAYMSSVNGVARAYTLADLPLDPGRSETFGFLRRARQPNHCAGGTTYYFESLAWQAQLVVLDAYPDIGVLMAFPREELPQVSSSN